MSGESPQDLVRAWYSTGTATYFGNLASLYARVRPRWGIQLSLPEPPGNTEHESSPVRCGFWRGGGKKGKTPVKIRPRMEMVPVNGHLLSM